MYKLYLFVEFGDGDKCVCDIGEGGEGGGRVAVGESGSWGRRWRWETGRRGITEIEKVNLQAKT